MAETTRDWQDWGRYDPLYAVASVPGRHKQGDNPWTSEEFYDSGRVEWAEIRPAWLDYAGSVHGTVLEIGCGAGRMSRQLVQAFDRLIAVDVSEDQMALAQEAVAGVGGNAEFRRSVDGGLPVGANEVDAVFTTQVLQHLQPALVERYLEDCGRALAPGGTVMLHIPIAGTSLTGSYLRDVARRPLAAMKLRLMRVGHRVGKTVPPMRFQVFDPAWVFERLERGGLTDAQLRTVQVGGMRVAFFMAQKPSDSAGAG